MSPLSLTVSQRPFAHLVVEGFASPAELAAANWAWPGNSWPGWVHGDARQPGKRVSDLSTPLPPPLAAILARVAALPLGDWLGLPGAVADLSLFGCGLHETAAGFGLDAHHDADTHPRLGLKRAWSAAVYVHPAWELRWGGLPELLSHLTQGASGCGYIPYPGTLLAFDARGPHRVTPTATDAPPRRSLALFGYLPEAGPGTRPRAEFLRADSAPPAAAG